MSDRRSDLLDATIAVIARRGVRGMRVQEVAAQAGVSVTLLYHYFGSREGLLDAALRAVDDRAGRYSEAAVDASASARDALRARLIAELQDRDDVRSTSCAWGELRWASVFDDSLRPTVAALTARWVDEIAELVDRVLDEEGLTVPDGRQSRGTAEILVALVEGLSGRWLTGAMPLEQARHLLGLAIDREVPSA